MPGFDGTGPGGQGPMTGGGRGFCAEPVSGRPAGSRRFFGFGRGAGRGRGRGLWGLGRGFRNRFWASGSETDQLKEQAEVLKQELADVESRLKAISD